MPIHSHLLKPPFTVAPRAADAARRPVTSPRLAKEAAVNACQAATVEELAKSTAETVATSTTTAAVEFAAGESKRWFRSGGGDGYDFLGFDGATTASPGGADHGLTVVAGVHSARRRLLERLLVTESVSDGDDIPPVPKEAGAAPSSWRATASSPSASEQVKRNHHQVATDPPLPEIAYYEPNPSEFVRNSARTTIAALDAATASPEAGFSSTSTGLCFYSEQDRARFSNDPDEQRATDTGKNGSIPGRAPTATETIAALTATDAASGASFSSSVSSISSDHGLDSGQGRESAGLTLRALLAEIASPSKWTTAATTTASVATASAEPPLLVHASVASCSSSSDLALHPSAFALPAQPAASSRWGISTGGGDGAGEVLHVLSDVSDSELSSTATTASSVGNSWRSSKSWSSVGYTASHVSEISSSGYTSEEDNGNSWRSSKSWSSVGYTASHVSEISSSGYTSEEDKDTYAGGSSAVTSRGSGTSRSEVGYAPSFSDSLACHSLREDTGIVSLNEDAGGGGGSRSFGGGFGGLHGVMIGGMSSPGRKALATISPRSGVNRDTTTADEGDGRRVDHSEVARSAAARPGPTTDPSSCTTTSSQGANLPVRRCWLEMLLVAR